MDQNTLILVIVAVVLAIALFGWLSRLAVGRWYDQSRDAA